MTGDKIGVTTTTRLESESWSEKERMKWDGGREQTSMDATYPEFLHHPGFTKRRRRSSKSKQVNCPFFLPMTYLLC